MPGGKNFKENAETPAATGEIYSETSKTLMMGIHLMDRGTRRQQIEGWYQRIERWAAGRILAVDSAVMHTWAPFCAKHRNAGRTLPAMDSLVAATALHHQLTLVTRNTGDFPEDVLVLNPWTA